jgi:hypothetical protein
MKHTLLTVALLKVQPMAQGITEMCMPDYMPYGVLKAVLCMPGDLNGDGVGELVCAEPQWECSVESRSRPENKPRAGRVRTLNGQSLRADADWKSMLRELWGLEGTWIEAGGTARWPECLGMGVCMLDDQNDDQVPDLVVATTWGRGGVWGELRILSGRTGAELRNLQGSSGQIGAWVHSTCDLDGDGKRDLISGPSLGWGPWSVAVLSSATGAYLRKFDDTRLGALVGDRADEALVLLERTRPDRLELRRWKDDAPVAAIPLPGRLESSPSFAIFGAAGAERLIVRVPRDSGVGAAVFDLDGRKAFDLAGPEGCTVAAHFAPSPDCNGDGVSDFVVAWVPHEPSIHPSAATRTTLVLHSGADGSAVAVFTLPDLRVNRDGIAAGDIDGDHKVDLAVSVEHALLQRSALLVWHDAASRNAESEPAQSRPDATNQR